MIQINLLPMERRRMERTPIGRFVMILAGIGLTVALAFVVFWIKFYVIPPAVQLRDDMKADLASEKTRQIEMENIELTTRDQNHKKRKEVIDKLRPPFRWSDVLDILCDKLETLHKKVWFDSMKVMEIADLRSRQQAMGTDDKFETGLLVEAQSAGSDPEPFLNLRNDVVYKPPTKTAAKAPPAGAAPAAPAGAPAPPRRTGKVLIDYFTGGIMRVVNFTLKDQNEFEERFSTGFSLEFFVKQGAATKTP